MEEREKKKIASKISTTHANIGVCTTHKNQEIKKK